MVILEMILHDAATAFKHTLGSEKMDHGVAKDQRAVRRLIRVDPWAC
jgi:hypothetical protein